MHYLRAKVTMTIILIIKIWETNLEWILFECRMWIRFFLESRIQTGSKGFWFVQSEIYHFLIHWLSLGTGLSIMFCTIVLHLKVYIYIYIMNNCWRRSTTSMNESPLSDLLRVSEESAGLRGLQHHRHRERGLVKMPAVTEIVNYWVNQKSLHSFLTLTVCLSLCSNHNCIYWP